MGNETSSIVNDTAETAYIKFYGTEVHAQGPPRYGTKTWPELLPKLEHDGFHELKPGETHISSLQTAGWRLDCGGYLVVERDDSGRPSKLEVFKVKNHLFCGSGGVPSVYRLKEIRQHLRYLEPTPIPKTLRDQAKDTIGSTLQQLREMPTSSALDPDNNKPKALAMFYVAIVVVMVSWFFLR